MAEERKSYRRINPQQVRLWRDRLAAVRKRLQTPPPKVQAVFANKLGDLEPHYGALERLIGVLERLAPVGPEGDEADFAALRQMLAPRLPRYTAPDHEADRETLLHVAGLTLDGDLGRLEELADMSDQLRHTETRMAAAREVAAAGDMVGMGTQLLQVLETLEDYPNEPQVQAFLKQLLTRDATTGEMEPAAQRIREQVVAKATELLAKSQAATGELPD